MKIGFIVITAFTAIVLFMLFKYESGKNKKDGLTGRGGDFES